MNSAICAIFGANLAIFGADLGRFWTNLARFVTSLDQFWSFLEVDNDAGESLKIVLVLSEKAGVHVVRFGSQRKTRV